MREDKNSIESLETIRKKLTQNSQDYSAQRIPDHQKFPKSSPLNSGSRAMSFGKFEDSEQFGKPLDPGSITPDSLSNFQLKSSSDPNDVNAPQPDMFSQRDSIDGLDEQLEAELMAEIGAQAPSLFINPISKNPDLSNASSKVMDDCHSLIEASTQPQLPIEDDKPKPSAQASRKISNKEIENRAGSLLHHNEAEPSAQPRQTLPKPMMTTRMLTSSAFVALAIFGGAVAYSGQPEELVKQTEKLLFARLADKDAAAISSEEALIESNDVTTSTSEQSVALKLIEKPKQIVREIQPEVPSNLTIETDQPLSQLSEVLGVKKDLNSANNQAGREGELASGNIQTAVLKTTTRKPPKPESFPNITDRFAGAPISNSIAKVGKITSQISTEEMTREELKLKSTELAFANTKDNERLQTRDTKTLTGIQAIEKHQPITIPVSSKRSIEDLRAKLGSANGSNALNADQQKQLITKLAAGECVADALVTVAGKVSPILMRDLLNSLNAEC